jgi:hypothetical protein
MYDYKRQEYKFQLGELGLIFKNPEKPKNAAWLRKLGIDWKIEENFIKRKSKKLKSIIL